MKPNKRARSDLCFASGTISLNQKKSKAHFGKVKKPLINGLNAYAFQLTVFIRAFEKQVAAHRYLKAEVSCQAVRVNHHRCTQKSGCVPE